MQQTQTFFAPGRVNLMGEHLDYNGGLVLPAAISLGVKATLTPRSDDKIILRSATHPFSKELFVDDVIAFDAANQWTNYPLGIMAQLRKEGERLSGCEIVYESTLPESSGLSSSAAVEVVTAFALLSQTQSNINRVWLANFCKQVENEFIGVQCGIMDQYAVALGKKDHALLLDCAALKHEYVQLELDDYRLLVMNTNKPRSLIHSQFNERRRQCHEALGKLRISIPGLQHLCDAQIHHLDLLSDEVLRKRAKHVISEQLRVKESAKALRMGDLHTFGRLMNASHESLKSDYEVSCAELDALAETAQEISGCLGARMTGAGFGGCAIALVHENAKEEFINKVSAHYFATTQLSCAVYDCTIEDGVHSLTS